MPQQGDIFDVCRSTVVADLLFRSAFSKIVRVTEKEGQPLRRHPGNKLRVCLQLTISVAAGFLLRRSRIGDKG